jgi:hypothetical protein
MYIMLAIMGVNNLFKFIESVFEKISVIYSRTCWKNAETSYFSLRHLDIIMLYFSGVFTNANYIVNAYVYLYRWSAYLHYYRVFDGKALFLN